MERRGRIIGGMDGTFGRDGIKSFGLTLTFVTCCMFFVSLCHNSLNYISLHKSFGVNFESRESDHTAVSGALNNPVRDTLNVSKVLTAALEESFV